MNPLTNVRNIQNLNKRELELGVPFATSWHQQYKDSAWLFMGGLDYELTEGDIISVFSQYGEIVNVNLVRDKKTGKTKGFGFLCYENQLSTVLAVDNLNGIKLCKRTIRVDHVEEYKVPKMREDMADEEVKLALEGCAPVPVFLEPKPPKYKAEIKKEMKKENTPAPIEAPQMVDGVLLPPRLFAVAPKSKEVEKVKKQKKEKKKKSKKTKKKRRNSTSSSDSSDEDELKKEKHRKSDRKETDRHTEKETRRSRTIEAFDGKRIKRERSEIAIGKDNKAYDIDESDRSKNRYNEDQRYGKRHDDNKSYDIDNANRSKDRYNDDQRYGKRHDDNDDQRYGRRHDDKYTGDTHDQYYKDTDKRRRLDDVKRNQAGEESRRHPDKYEDSRYGFSDEWARNDGRR